ncbi:MAG: hypothetical protein ACKOWQ_03380 [Aquirufa sp.]
MALVIINFLAKFYTSFLSIIKVLFQTDFSLEKLDLKEETCLILGNGPSVNATIEKDLEKVQQMFTICVNHFGSTDPYEVIQPKMYMLLDPLFKDSNYELGQKLIDNILQKTTWPLIVYMPQDFKHSTEMLQRLKSNPNIQVYFFNYTIVNGFERLNQYFFQKGWGMIQSQNILVCAIFQALQLGFRKIYITGADHTWHENMRVSDLDNSLLLNDTHFYGAKDINLSTRFAPKPTVESQLAVQFLSLHKVFLGHQKNAQLAKDRGIRIINVSQHSNIDVYERGGFK